MLITSTISMSEPRKSANAKLALIVAAFAIGGYIANWAFGWWYDIPLKVDAINNALYQLLSKP